MAMKQSNIARTRPSKGQKVRKVGKRRQNRQSPPTQRVAAATNVGVAFKMPTKRISSLPNGVISVHNKEIVFTVQGTATAGVIAAGGITGIPVGLGSTNFTWLSKFSSIYDKYVFKSLKLTFVPTLPTTTSGATAVYFDSDEAATPTTTFAQAAVNEAALVCPVFEQCSVSIPPHMLNLLPWYGVTAAPVTQGFVNGAHTEIVLLNAAAAGTTNLGYVMVEYIVHMKNATS